MGKFTDLVRMIFVYLFENNVYREKIPLNVHFFVDLYFVQRYNGILRIREEHDCKKFEKKLLIHTKTIH